MYYSRKLKQDFRIVGLIPAIIIVLSFIFTWILFGIRTGYFLLSIGFLLYAVFSIFIYSRTRNISYVAASLFQGFYGLYLLFNPKGLLRAPDAGMANFFLVCSMISTIWLVYLLSQRKTKWKGREVFEMAAKSIEPDPDGFTSRPRPIGKTEYSMDELMGFAEFLRKNLIAMPHREDNIIIFIIIKMGEELGYMFNPERFRQNGTWISFDFDGNVSVSMSKKDYLDFKEELSFDQLCDNMGKLFISFMEYYKKGEPQRILDKLNELKLGLMS
jgi:hypothetical protein